MQLKKLSGNGRLSESALTNIALSDSGLFPAISTDILIKYYTFSGDITPYKNEQYPRSESAF